jgi:hypothetical protein
MLRRSPDVRRGCFPLWDRETWIPLDRWIGWQHHAHSDGGRCSLYLTKMAPAKESDLWIPLVELLWQRLSYPDLVHVLAAIEDDFHLPAASSAKLEHPPFDPGSIDGSLIASFVTPIPIAMAGYGRTRLANVALLCATCHRVIHPRIDRAAPVLVYHPRTQGHHSPERPSRQRTNFISRSSSQEGDHSGMGHSTRRGLLSSKPPLSASARNCYSVGMNSAGDDLSRSEPRVTPISSLPRRAGSHAAVEHRDPRLMFVP